MGLPSLASTTLNVAATSQPIAPNVTSSEKGKSELNRMTDELKHPPSTDAPKQNKSTLQRSQKPLQQNPFKTYRDPATGQWMVERNKR